MKKHTDEMGKYEELAIEEVAYGNQHALNILIDILIEKGIINEQELKDRLEQGVEESSDFDEVNVLGNEDFEEEDE